MVFYLIFFSYVRTQFTTPIKAVQCDNSREFDNSSARTFFLTHGVVLRMSCPYTFQQNGCAERTLHTLNNIVRSLLFQASLPPVYWADSLHTATHVINRHPTKTLDGHTHSLLFMAHNHPTLTFGFLAVPAIQTSPPQLHINCHLAHLCVSSLDIPPITKGTGVLTFNPIRLLSLGMSCLMRLYFLSPKCPPPLRIPTHRIF
jgi:hypothetical protein